VRSHTDEDTEVEACVGYSDIIQCIWQQCTVV